MRYRLALAGGLAAALVVGAEGVTGRLHAQAPAASGIPTLGGYWDAGLVYGQPGGPRAPRVEASLLKLINARAKAVIAALDEYASPKYDCMGGAAPHILVDLFKLRVEQRDDRLIFSYEKDDVVRTIWLEGHNHPQPRVTEYFQEGYSSGRYEGGKLIVVTTKFTYDPMGMTWQSPFVPSSTRKKVTETYWREGDLLKVNVVTEDPVFLKGPWTFSHQWKVSDGEFYEYGCSIETAQKLLPFLPPKYVD